jgi:hypothetical protein
MPSSSGSLGIMTKRKVINEFFCRSRFIVLKEKAKYFVKILPNVISAPCV